MKTKINFYILFILLSLWGMMACTKYSSTEVGYDAFNSIFPMPDFRDTVIDVSAQTYEEVDTTKFFFLYSGNKNLIYPAIGRYENNDFGKKQASLFFSLERENTTTSPFAGTTIQVDSVRLFLVMPTYTGDTLANLNFNVYQLQDVLKSYRGGYIYPFSQSVDYTNTVLANYTNTNISAIKKQSYRPSSLNIEIDKSNPFIDGLVKASADVWASETSFNQFFKGLAVVPDVSSSSNSIVNIDLTDTGTYLAVYYSSVSDGTTATNKIAKFSFLLRDGSPSGVANNIVWDKTTGTINNYLKSPTQNEDYVFVQTNLRSKVRININGLLNGSMPANATIYNAELIAMEVAPNPIPLNRTKTTPSQLFLVQYDSFLLKSYINLQKDYIAGVNFRDQRAYLGGTRIDSTDANGVAISAYTFNITRLVQNTISKKIQSYPLILISQNTPPYLDNLTIYNQIMHGQVKLYGGGTSTTSTDKKMYIRVKYSFTK